MGENERAAQETPQVNPHTGLNLMTTLDKPKGKYEPKVQCKAKAKATGKQCRRPAIPGGEVCRVHGGSAPQVKKAAQKRLALQEGYQAVLAMVGEHGLPEAGDISPGEQLLRGLRFSSMMVQSLSRVAAEHEPDSSVAQALERERDRHARLSKAILDAGIAERQVRIAEKTAQVFANAIYNILRALGVPQTEETIEIVRSELMAVDFEEDTDGEGFQLTG